MLDNLGTLKNLHQLSDIRFYGCASITKLPETIALLKSRKMFGIKGYLTAEGWSCDHWKQMIPGPCA
jgi:hypothetical protein